jgi:hypothetical protein
MNPMEVVDIEKRLLAQEALQRAEKNFLRAHGWKPRDKLEELWDPPGSYASPSGKNPKKRDLDHAVNSLKYTLRGAPIGSPPAEILRWEVEAKRMQSVRHKRCEGPRGLQPGEFTFGCVFSANRVSYSGTPHWSDYVVTTQYRWSFFCTTCVVGLRSIPLSQWAAIEAERNFSNETEDHAVRETFKQLPHRGLHPLVFWPPGALAEASPPKPDRSARPFGFELFGSEASWVAGPVHFVGKLPPIDTTGPVTGIW